MGAIASLSVTENGWLWPSPAAHLVIDLEAGTASKPPFGKMPKKTDEKFYDRADAVIALANEQSTEIDRGKVSASLMFATARFNSFVSACRASSSEDLASGKEEIIEYFMKQYRMMLAENLDDYVTNFEKYTSGSD